MASISTDNFVEQ